MFSQKYTTFSRLVGEWGGKNFHFVHPIANIQSAVIGTIFSGFEYSSKKCSACLRLYIPKKLWFQFNKKFEKISKQLKLGDVRDNKTFL